jgi:hypothetical protein
MRESTAANHLTIPGYGKFTPLSFGCQIGPVEETLARCLWTRGYPEGFVKISIAVIALFLLLTLPPSAAAQTLERFASLPADTFAPGPTSGQFIDPANGRTPPFPNKQPVQGISSVLRTGSGDFLVMSDNGFGAKGNSADYVLRVYRISPDFRTKHGGPGTIEVQSFFTLRDPRRRVNFPIVADGELYPNSATPVDPSIRERRLLTGGDFDIESFREAPDDTLWFGDEFGPFLIHTDRTGKVLEPPYPLPGVKSPQNPFLGNETPNLPSSRGFEGMAITPDGKTLYPMLEGALTTDPDQRRLIINQFDLRKRRYTGRQWFYRLEAAGHAIGDFTAITDKRFLVIERDNLQGEAAAFKKIYVVDLNVVDRSGFLVKREVADLLQIADPHDIGGQGPVFRFPFQTIESVIPLSNTRLGVLDDNNYPFSSARVPGQPDPNEFIVIRLDRPLVKGPRPHGNGWWDDDDR